MPAPDLPPFDMPAAEALDAAGAGRLVLLDLRKAEAVRRSGRILPGAKRRDPFAFGHDDPLTRIAGPVAVFCVHGHEVSLYGAALLRLHGVAASRVAGGFEALVAAGAVTAPCQARDEVR